MINSFTDCDLKEKAAISQVKYMHSYIYRLTNSFLLWGWSKMPWVSNKNESNIIYKWMKYTKKRRYNIRI